MDQKERAKKEELGSCNICMCDLREKVDEKDQYEQLVILDSCKHMFHGFCVAKYFHIEVDSSRFPLKCPNDQCKQEVMVNDLRYLLSQEYLDKYYERTFSKAADIQSDICWCPTPNCAYAFVFDNEKGKHRFNCPKCLH